MTFVVDAGTMTRPRYSAVDQVGVGVVLDNVSIVFIARDSTPVFNKSGKRHTYVT